MNVLVSRCLLGYKCRYDGLDNKIPYLKEIKEKYPKINFISICPEVDGGLEIPRKACEIRYNRAITIDLEDKTLEFKKGAKFAKDLALKNKVKFAILKEKSPSCGKDLVYDGTFSHILVKGDGFTCKELKKCGIIIFSEREIDKFLSFVLKNHLI